MTPGQPSATALLVASSVTRRGRCHGLPPVSLRRAGQALRAAGGTWWWVARLARHRAGRWLLDRAEACVLPGLADHHCRRKAWLLRRLRDAPRPSRAVWLGTGFDALGETLQTYVPQCEPIETDHPATLALRGRCDPAGGRTARRIPLVLPDACGHLLELCNRPGALLVAEGLLMYLPPRPLLRLLRRLACLPHPPRLLLTALAPVDGGPGFRRHGWCVDAWLRSRSEPFLWRVAPGRLVRVLERHGYACQASWDGEGYGEYAIDAVVRRA